MFGITKCQTLFGIYLSLNLASLLWLTQKLTIRSTWKHVRNRTEEPLRLVY